MDKQYSGLIVVLLAGILFVLLVGRDAAQEAISMAFWVGLVLGVLALTIWDIVAFIRAIPKRRL